MTIMPRQTSMDPPEPGADADRRLARVLTLAVDTSGVPRCRIAATAGMHKDTLLRALRGEKSVSFGEAERILGACGVPVLAVLALAHNSQEELAQDGMRNGLADFLDPLMAALPDAIAAALGERVSDLRPRWAKGTAQLVARVLAKHLAEFEERDLALIAGR